MTATLLDGKAVSNQRKKILAEKIAQRMSEGFRKPGLAVIIVGEDPASTIYVSHKRTACEQVGITSLYFPMKDTTTQEELLALIHQLNNDKTVDGILCQLPLPKSIDESKILEAIAPTKDVDGFHPYTIGRLLQRRPTLRPCTPFGIINLLQDYNIKIEGLNATVVGASNIVGRPMALELLQAGATVTICHRMTKDVKAFTRESDLVVVAVGKPSFLVADDIKEGAIIVDVGINRLPDGRVVGDVDFDSIVKKASFITPVPGGVGPMTVLTLMENTFAASLTHA